MALIIGGHPRSGTTLLRNLCNGHPDMTVTHEFTSFAHLNKFYNGYSHQLLKKWWRFRNRSFIAEKSVEKRWGFVLQSHIFVARYLFNLNKVSNGPIDAVAVEVALHHCFPETQVVGDKYPAYVFMLDKLVGIDSLVRLIIYRDCRDVITSVLKMVQTEWRNLAFIKKLDTAEKVARRWVKAIELMERYADKLYLIRYEDLISYPERELNSIGRFLGVDSKGFPKEIIRNNSFGKYKPGLTEDQLARVMDIAGPTMARLDYL